MYKFEFIDSIVLSHSYYSPTVQGAGRYSLNNVGHSFLNTYTVLMYRACLQCVCINVYVCWFKNKSLMAGSLQQ